MAKRSRKPKKEEKPKLSVGRLLGLLLKLFTTGKELMVAAASLIAALIAMSGSCSNLQRADASYAALAVKVNDMSSRLDGIESGLDELRSRPSLSPKPVEPLPPAPAPLPNPGSDSDLIPDKPIDKLNVGVLPRSMPLPPTLDLLMQQVPPAAKK